MRSLLRLSLPLFGLLIVLFSTGCGSDGGGVGGVVLGPVIQLNIGDDFVSEDEDLDLGTNSFTVSVTGNDGDAALRSLRITEDGVDIPASRLDFGPVITPNNPILLLGGDQDGFTYEIEITQAAAAPGAVRYEFTLTDENGEMASEDIQINYIQTSPGVELLIQDGFVSGDATVTSFGGVFDVRVRSTALGDQLQSLAVLEDGVLLDDSRLSFNGGDVASMNPLVFATGEMDAATYRIRISPEGTTNQTRTYTFRAIDVNGVAGETSVDITFDTPPGTELQFEMTGVFFNASGARDGGLDLDNGTAVSFNSGEAEIQDEGVNLRIPVGTENWRAQISSGNDAEVRLVNLSAISDGLTFAGVTTQEVIRMAYDMGSQLDGDDNFPDADGDQSASELVSRPLLGAGPNREGEVFAIFRGTRYYLVSIDSVNFVANSNADNYSVSIKY